MVLINEKKYACATCIKGHRVSSCTHTERPLFEVKKKGRPQTQCTHCKERRKGGIAHVKCQCEATCGSKATASKEPLIIPQASTASDGGKQDTRKGQPGSHADFPNGLKDVHEMAAAADALAGLTGEAATNQERKITNLLNPCNCATTGICRCCGPPSKRGHRPEPRRAPSSDAASPSGTATPLSTDQLLADMLSAKATTGSSSPAANSVGSWLASSETFMSPSANHHPKHTNPHVHKTKLYSPYTTPMSARKQAQQAAEPSSRPRSSSRASSHSIKPLANIDTLLSAIFTPDGQAAKSIPRAALGLPGINTFLDPQQMSDGSEDAETPRQETQDMLVDFPTSEPVDLAACTCGDDCECPGCAVHANGDDGSGAPKSSHGGCCGEGCTSKYDCAKHLSLPSGITSIEHLISLAAANVPAPPDRGRGFGLKLEPNDVSVLPSAHQATLDEEAARAMGVVQLKPLECCNGRCQCPPGNCTCMKDCCGCCARCLCEEEILIRPNQTDGNEPVQASVEETAAAPPASSCCSTKAKLTPAPVPSTSAMPVLSPIPQRAPVQSSSPAETTGGSCCKSAAPAPPVQRRPSSSLRMSQASSSRRTSVSNPTGSLQRSASTGKSTSKALALHLPPNHPRLILPKPQAGKLSMGATPTTSRSASPGRGSRVSSPSPSLTSSVSQTSTQPSAPASLQSSNTSPSQPDDVNPFGVLGGQADGTADVNMTDADMMACFEELARNSAFQQLSGPQQPPRPLDYAALEAMNKQPSLNMLTPYEQSASAHHPYPQSQPMPQYGAFPPTPSDPYYGMQQAPPPTAPPMMPPGHMGPPQPQYSPYPSQQWGWQQQQQPYPGPQPNPQPTYYPAPNYATPPDDLIAVVARLVSTGQLPPSVLSLNGGGGQGPPLDLRQILALQAQQASAGQPNHYAPPQQAGPIMPPQPVPQPQQRSSPAAPVDPAALSGLLQSMSSTQYDFPQASQPAPGDQTLFDPPEDAFDFEAFLLQSSGSA